MAGKVTKTKQEAKPGEGGSILGFVAVLVVLTAIAGGGGFFFATSILPPPEAKSPGPDGAAPKPDDKTASHDAKPDPHDSQGEAAAHPPVSSTEAVALAPLLTNLREPKGAFIRLEGMVIVDKGLDNVTALTAQISEDIIAFLRATSLAQIEGPTGLQHLREDLNDRIRLRSEGKAHELIIQTMVIE